MRHRVRSIGLHEDRALVRTRAVFLELRGAADAEHRRAEIAALPSKDWRGTRVYEMRCSGDFGKGPHEVFLPERLLWALIDLTNYHCPFHAV